VICDDKELLYEEAPQAYKNIPIVIDDLVKAGACGGPRRDEAARYLQGETLTHRRGKSLDAGRAGQGPSECAGPLWTHAGPSIS
jgi:hypothetical protein